MRLPLVMYVGQLGSGKDTVAGMMRDLVPKSDFITLAAPMKEFAKKVFGFTQDQMYGGSALREQEFIETDNRVRRLFELNANSFLDSLFPPSETHPTPRYMALESWFRGIMDKGPRTGRHVLQTLGTEFGRAQDQDVWIRAGINGAMEKLVSGSNLVTMTDGRFKNEILQVKRAGGTIIRVLNPNSTSTSKHLSELEQESIPDFWFDFVLVNDKANGLPWLAKTVEALTATVISDPYRYGVAKR